MSSFSESSFIKRLSELNNTQQSIQTLSLWLIHHRKHSKSIVQIWQKELKKAKADRKLVFLYLANDVIQNSRKKGPEFSKDFGSVLPDAYKNAAKEADDKTKGSMERLTNIWLERNIYDKTFMNQLKNCVGGSSARSSTSGKTNPVTEPPPPKKKKQEQFLSLREEVEAMLTKKVEPPPDSDTLVARLSELENSASSDAAVREKIAALPPEVSDISHFDKIQNKEEAEKLSKTVDDACILLADYNKRLVAELEERKIVARMLKEYISDQKDRMQDAKEKIEEYKDKLVNVANVRTELKSHIQNLPDLTLLPDITGGLMPLPSAGDLFRL